MTTLKASELTTGALVHVNTHGNGKVLGWQAAPSGKSMHSKVRIQFNSGNVIDFATNQLNGKFIIGHI